MNFTPGEKIQKRINELQTFMHTHIYPVEKEVNRFHAAPENLWKEWPGLGKLKNKARDSPFWNAFLPPDHGAIGAGFSNLEYAFLAAEMGKVIWASEVFNCSAPDTGNMEVLSKYGTEMQKRKWLDPLLQGKIRSAFLMTEPDVASSDATNIRTRIEDHGDFYILNGTKWWASGAMHPHCELAIVMGKTDDQAARHRQQSMILVPLKSEGVKIKRPLPVFGYFDSPEGHAEVELRNVKVPKDHLLLGEGRGFEIAQGRLGPGRIHHCMRLIGMAERALEIMIQRCHERTAFGKIFIEFSSIKQEIAVSYCEIEQARLLTLSAADAMDKLGNKSARKLISMIKIVAPSMAQKVIDRAMQILGGKGLSEDSPLAHFFAAARALRLADGPDEVHRHQLGKYLINGIKN